jgi:Tfp pilus assembly protein PilV
LNKRRGETLIEVMVSFGIMSFVILGTSGLVTSLIAQITSTRTLTQAVTLAQEGLVQGVAIFDTQCDVREENLSNLPIVKQDIVTKDVNGIHLSVDVRALDETTEETATDGTNDSLTFDHGFRKVIATTSWVDKAGNNRLYVLEQVVRK